MLLCLVWLGSAELSSWGFSFVVLGYVKLGYIMLRYFMLAVIGFKLR